MADGPSSRVAAPSTDVRRSAFLAIRWTRARSLHDTGACADRPACRRWALSDSSTALHLWGSIPLLAGMGDERRHVAAKHSVEMISRAQVAELDIGLGSIFVPTVGRFSGAIGAGVQVLFLRYSRENELQADAIGLRYAYGLGYDVR